MLPQLVLGVLWAFEWGGEMRGEIWTTEWAEGYPARAGALRKGKGMPRVKVMLLPGIRIGNFGSSFATPRELVVWFLSIELIYKLYIGNLTCECDSKAMSKRANKPARE